VLIVPHDLGFKTQLSKEVISLPEGMEQKKEQIQSKDQNETQNESPSESPNEKQNQPEVHTANQNGEQHKNSLPKRDEVDDRFKWDLTKIFDSDAKWEEAFQEVKSLLPETNAFQGSLTESAQKLAEGLRLRDKLSSKMAKVYVYAHLKKDEDSTNPTYIAFEDRAKNLFVKVNSALSFVVPEILNTEEETIRQYFLENKQLHMYEHALDEIMRQKEHVLSAAEEAVLAQTGELASAPNDIYTMISNADMKFPSVTDEHGEERELTHGRFRQFMQSPDRSVRKQAFEAMYSTYRKQINTLAATLNASIKKDVFMARVRKYPSSLHAGVFKDNIDTEVYKNLINTIHEHLPLFRRYLQLRQKALGVEQLHMYDIYVPFVQDAGMTFSYEQAQELVLQSLSPLGDEYVTEVKKGLTDGWVDVYENVGKRSGAYSAGTYGTPPYILMNYEDTLDDVFTLAHELGHSMHSYYSRKEQPYVYSNYTIFVAEVASTLNEALLTRYLLEKTDDPHQKFYILDHYLDGFRGAVFRQTMFAEYEMKIHEKVEQGEALTADTLSKLYYGLNKQYFGEVMDIDRDIELEWARIPHFYYTFYVYKYATGYAAAAALSKQILEEGAPAVKRYLSFLKSGGSDYPLELLKKAGVDMTSPEPIREALQVFSSTLDELEQLIEEVK
jgi:oligoendopeptidase F